jgi:hypothetical protein
LPARPPNPAHGAVRSGASAGSYQRCQITDSVLLVDDGFPVAGRHRTTGSGHCSQPRQTG